MSQTGPFQKWLANVTELFDFLEQAAGRARTVGPPPPADDAALRVDALVNLWQRCQFSPLASGSPAPWESKASLLSDHLRRAPVDFLRSLFVHVSEALTAALKEAGTDSQQRLITTEGLPFFTFAVPGMVEKVDRKTYLT